MQAARFQVYFYRTEAGNEPVRGFLMGLDKDARRIVGVDIEKVKLVGPQIGLPTVGHLGGGLYEVRSTVSDGKQEICTLFRCVGPYLLLLHAFQKTTQKTPKHAIGLAEERWSLAKGKQP